MATERSDITQFKGTPVTLVGDPVSEGDTAPNATLVGGDMADVNLEQWSNKVRVLNVVPSLDTPVCDAQTRRFNEEAAQWGDKAVVLTISMDLPFAQKRWCAATGSENVVALSDFRARDFGEKFGMYIKELGLLARGTFVVDAEGTIKHAAITPEIGEHPDYDAVTATVKTLL